MLNTCSGARARGRAQRLPPKSKQRYLFRLLLPSHYTLFMTTVTRAPLLLRVRAEKTGRGGNPFTWRHASATCGNVISTRARLLLLLAATCVHPALLPGAGPHTSMTHRFCFLSHLLLLLLTTICFHGSWPLQSRAADNITHRGPLLEPPAFPSSGNMFSPCVAAMEPSRTTA